MRRCLALVLAVLGCASGGRPDDQLVDGGSPRDGQVTLDGASMIDAGPQARTLSQTASQALKPATSIACGGNGTAANNYYRVFDLPAFGITTDFKVSQVSFQIEHCNQLSGSNGATVAVRVGTYSGTPGATLATANMTILASNPTVMVPEVIEDLGPPAVTPGGTVNAPITATIPAGQKLLVEVDAPNGTNVYEFYMGANDGGETGFGYVLAPTCSINVPTNISSVIPSPVHLLLTVTGTY
jgi:hypothetical protein